MDTSEKIGSDSDPLVLAMCMEKTKAYIPRLTEQFEPSNRPLFPTGASASADASFVAAMDTSGAPQVATNSKFTIAAFLVNAEDRPWTRTVCDLHLLMALNDPKCSGGQCLSNEEALQLALAIQLKDANHVESFRPKIEYWADIGYRDPIMYAQGRVSGALTAEGLAKACANEHQTDDTFEVICPLCAARARNEEDRSRKYGPPFAEHIRDEHSDLLPDVIDAHSRFKMEAWIERRSSGPI